MTSAGEGVREVKRRRREVTEVPTSLGGWCAAEAKIVVNTTTARRATPRPPHTPCLHVAPLPTPDPLSVPLRHHSRHLGYAKGMTQHHAMTYVGQCSGRRGAEWPGVVRF